MSKPILCFQEEILTHVLRKKSILNSRVTSFKKFLLKLQVKMINWILGLGRGKSFDRKFSPPRNIS